MKRLILLFAAICLLLCSCGAPATEDFFQFEEGSETQHPNGLCDNDTVFTVNGYDINYSELKYYMNVLDASKEDIEAKVLPELLFNRGVALMAEEAEITVTADEYDDLTDYLDETAEDEEYEKQLALGAMTDSLFRFVALQSQLTTKVYEHYTNESTTPVKASDAIIFGTAESGELIRVKHILFQVENPQEAETVKQEAESVLQMIHNGESFDSLIEQYSDYKSENEIEVGEYIYRYEMPQQFEEAAFKLNEGETSELVYVRSDAYTGYHIIMRLKPDNAYVEQNLDTLRVNYMASQFYKTAYSKIQEMKIEYTDNFNKV